MPGVPRLRTKVARPGHFKGQSNLACHAFEPKWDAQGHFPYLYASGDLYQRGTPRVWRATPLLKLHPLAGMPCLVIQGARLTSLAPLLPLWKILPACHAMRLACHALHLLHLLASVPRLISQVACLSSLALYSSSGKYYQRAMP
ncbi:hypothetical protein AHAS_Ahas09G0138100 [Arachis hypogaea]